MKNTKRAESVREIGDHRIASDVLLAFRIELAGATGLELAASCATGRCAGVATIEA
jgi:hypothetical protein